MIKQCLIQPTLGLILCFVFLFSNTAYPQLFPKITTKTLSNQPITLPIKNKTQLLILGFDRESSTPMYNWVKTLNLTSSSNLEWYQVAIIGGVPPFIDGFIKKGMKASTPVELHTRTIPYFGNKFEILEAISTKNPLNDSIIPILVIIDGRSNQILFKHQGLSTTKNIQLITERLNNGAIAK